MFELPSVMLLKRAITSARVVNLIDFKRELHCEQTATFNGHSHQWSLVSIARLPHSRTVADIILQLRRSGQGYKKRHF